MQATREPTVTRPEASPAEDELVLLPLRNLVLFPGVILPIELGRARSVSAAQAAMQRDEPLGLVLQRDAEIEEPAPEDLYPVGTTATLLRYLTAPDGSHYIICQGRRRFRILRILQREPHLVARVEYPEREAPLTKEIEALAHRLRLQAREALALLPQAPPELSSSIEEASSPSALADLIANFIDTEPEKRQGLLETFGVAERLEAVSRLLEHRIEVLRLSREIGQRTREELEKGQREHILREQLRTIQRELGESDGKTDEIASLEGAIARAQMPEEVEKQARQELARLARMPESAAEYSMVRTYLDWLVALPWSVVSEESIDIERARRILDEDHYDLEKVKRRMLEYLAVRKLNPRGRSPILCLVGPPGVGKTSLGQSIARAMGRKFVRVSLGGIHDEAEIRGHRRTYIGALPGNILQGLRKAGTRNPVFMLDELDKLGVGFHGDPSSALLEVLDPEQNSTFRDNYLGVPFDLSQVAFLGTANYIDGIPGPLRDRCEVITLPGYIEEDKVQIARHFLVRRQLEANGLSPAQCEITDAALRELTRHYTREAGCRNLQREIGAVFRQVAMRVAEGAAERVVVDAPDIRALLGSRRFESEVAMRVSVPGVATGMAWTPTGGDLLFVEATLLPAGRGKLILTGHLGEVMKESAQTALSLVKSTASELGVAYELVERRDIHIHVPAGAIPKDGPSAGVAMYVALVSLLTNRSVRADVAMTGEISLRGLVLPVGGIREKVVAAVSAGIRAVLLPERNRKDYEEIPPHVREKLEFVWIGHVADAARAALGPSLPGEPRPSGGVEGVSPSI